LIVSAAFAWSAPFEPFSVRSIELNVNERRFIQSARRHAFNLPVDPEAFLIPTTWTLWDLLLDVELISANATRSTSQPTSRPLIIVGKRKSMFSKKSPRKKVALTILLYHLLS
jgi:hypothetical protein